LRFSLRWIRPGERGAGARGDPAAVFPASRSDVQRVRRAGSFHEPESARRWHLQRGLASQIGSGNIFIRSNILARGSLTISKHFCKGTKNLFTTCFDFPGLSSPDISQARLNVAQTSQAQDC
jgi:hypothetical protein